MLPQPSIAGDPVKVSLCRLFVVKFCALFGAVDRSSKPLGGLAATGAKLTNGVLCEKTMATLGRLWTGSRRARSCARLMPDVRALDDHF